MSTFAPMDMQKLCRIAHRLGGARLFRPCGLEREPNGANLRAGLTSIQGPTEGMIRKRGWSTPATCITLHLCGTFLRRASAIEASQLPPRILQLSLFTGSTGKWTHFSAHRRLLWTRPEPPWQRCDPEQGNESACAILNRTKTAAMRDLPGRGFGAVQRVNDAPPESTRSGCRR